MDNHYHEENVHESTRKTCLNMKNIVNKKHNPSKQGYSFKFEHIVDFTFSSDNKENNRKHQTSQTQQYSNRLFLGNHVSFFIKSHFQKNYHSRQYLYRQNPSGAISIPDDLYHEMTSLQCQVLNLLQYEYIKKNKILDIHIAYLQKIHCLGIILYYKQDAYDDDTKLSLHLSIFNKYFNVIGFIDHRCSKYWECHNAKCGYQLNKITDMNNVIFFCEKCKNDFTFQHNPNNHHYHQSCNSKKVRSCIKYRFLSLAQLNNNHNCKINNVYNKKNLFTKNLFHEMSHTEFKALSTIQPVPETEKAAKVHKNAKKIDWMNKLMLHNLEKWFDHKAGTKIGLNDYHFGNQDEDEIFDGEHNEIANLFVRCRDSEGQRHGVDHECVSCAPHLLQFNHGDNDAFDQQKTPSKTWLCSLCQRTIPIEVKTCICLSSSGCAKHIEYKSNKDKDCLIVIKELAETLHSTISFNEIAQEFKTSSRPFEYEVCFNGEIVANGHGNSKRKAQRNGAEIALNELSLRGHEINRKITLLKQFDRIGYYELDPNLFVEICVDISDEQHMYSMSQMHGYTSMINPRCMRSVIIDETPDIIAYKTRIFEISHLEEPSVLGYLNVRGSCKFSLVCGIFHKDVNNGRYGYNYNEKKKKKRKSGKRRRKSSKKKATKITAVDAAMNTMNINEVSTIKCIGLQRNKNMYAHPSKYVDHGIYSKENSPMQYKQSKRRRSRRLSQKVENETMDGVYICCECGKYFADNSNGRYLSRADLKWLCFGCLKKMKDAYLAPFIECSVYTDRKNVENTDKKTVTPPMTPPSSDEDNNTRIVTNIVIDPSSPSLNAVKGKKNKEEGHVQNAAATAHETDSVSQTPVKTVETMSTGTQCGGNAYKLKNKENESSSSVSSPSSDEAHVQNGTKENDAPNKRKYALQMQHHHHNGYHNPRHHNGYNHYLHGPPLENITPHIHHANIMHHNELEAAQHSHILYAAPYNLQYSWNAYYGHQHHRNMMFMDNLHHHHPYDDNHHHNSHSPPQATMNMY